MAKFALAYPDREFVQTVSAQIPWSHNTAILDKVKDQKQRIWYIKKAAENGWSHSVLIHQIESGLYQRQAIAEKVSNYSNRLPVPQSELAVQTMKDPYIFDFIPFREDMVERDIERALVQDVTKLHFLINFVHLCKYNNYDYSHKKQKMKKCKKLGSDLF